MTRDEFESKRAENLDRLAEIRETSSARNKEYKNKHLLSHSSLREKFSWAHLGSLLRI